jgi:hypothetical protein
MQNKIRVLVFVFMVIGVTANSNAQLNYGIKAGLNFSAQSEAGNLYDGQNYKTGKVFGLTMGYGLNDILSINTEVLYQTKGAKNQNNLEHSIADATYDFDYLTIPVLIEAKFSEQLGLPAQWGVYGYAGPYYGWMLNASSDMNDSEVGQTSIDDFASETDYGAVFGIGVSRKLNSIELYSDIRYEMGMAEVISYDNDLRNKTIALSVGINF